MLPTATQVTQMSVRSSMSHSEATSNNSGALKSGVQYSFAHSCSASASFRLVMWCLLGETLLKSNSTACKPFSPVSSTFPGYGGECGAHVYDLDVIVCL